MGRIPVAIVEIAGDQQEVQPLIEDQVHQVHEGLALQVEEVLFAQEGARRHFTATAAGRRRSAGRCCAVTRLDGRDR